MKDTARQYLLNTGTAVPGDDFVKSTGTGN